LLVGKIGNGRTQEIEIIFVENKEGTPLPI
jgi:hypothetical protein